MLGAVTAAGGGMIRDIAVGRLPTLGGTRLCHERPAGQRADGPALPARAPPRGHGRIALSAVVSVSARRFGRRLPVRRTLAPAP
ncbi:TRIC cation channel family protein [Kocuria rhizophila]|nr:TRIC cation channel family protein [Kocuria rhizophila]